MTEGALATTEGRKPRLVVLFDGVCNLCNGAVQFIIDHDPNARFQFAALQSPEGKQALVSVGREHVGETLECLVLIDDDASYECSTAVLRVCYHLGGLWRPLWLLRVFPRALRDAVYKLVARNRYRIFGKTAECRIPTPALRARFLDSLKAHESQSA